MRTPVLFTLLLAAVPAAAEGDPTAQAVPEGVTQILPRGSLTSLDEPDFVPASGVEMPDDQWVLGVEIEGVAHAYDLNLLNHHEVVNDRFGDLPVAAVW